MTQIQQHQILIRNVHNIMVIYLCNRTKKGKLQGKCPKFVQILKYCNLLINLHKQCSKTPEKKKKKNQKSEHFLFHKYLIVQFTLNDMYATFLQKDIH